MMGFRPWGNMKGPCRLLGRKGPRGAPVALGGLRGKLATDPPATVPTPVTWSQVGEVPQELPTAFSEKL